MGTWAFKTNVLSEPTCIYQGQNADAPPNTSNT